VARDLKVPVRHITAASLQKLARYDFRATSANCAT
jgi:hypothetical protein